MMELIELQEDHIVGLRIDGKVDNETFDRVLAEIEDRLTRHDKIRLYVELVSLGGIGLEALFKDMKFGLGNWRRFEREAVVSDRSWVHKIASVADRPADALGGGKGVSPGGKERRAGLGPGVTGPGMPGGAK